MGRAYQHLQYFPFGELFVSQRNSSFDSRYKFSAKELDNETGYSYFGARYYDSDLSSWLSVDPMSDKYPGLSPYVFCSNNPANRIDRDGMKDTTFVAGKDKQVSPKTGTATPIRNPDGTINTNAYNCHSYAWESSQGDPTDPRNTNLVQNGVTKWDNNPDNNMSSYTQLGANDPNQKGDRVIYYTDANGNGRYDMGENIEHSAIVQTVDKNGNTATVIGKMGQAGISENHPTAPGYYVIDAKGNPTSRAYFRSPSSSTVSSPELSFPDLKFDPYVMQRNATYVAPPIIIPIRKE
ncbi:MAG TPA: RHS repeat-associated core domain-containing protein [Bacteroidales bacterium]|nr:RHS repeat-associated core domain-containing protein [Bacteroidales bacterium]